MCECIGAQDQDVKNAIIYRSARKRDLTLLLGDTGEKRTAACTATTAQRTVAGKCYTTAALSYMNSKQKKNLSLLQAP